MKSGTAQLVTKTITYDSIGQPVETKTNTEIFVSERAITRAEWSEAGRLGLKPELKLVTPFMNYNGEDEVIYNGKTYGIYRTYQNGDSIELYLEAKGGL